MFKLNVGPTHQKIVPYLQRARKPARLGERGEIMTQIALLLTAPSIFFLILNFQTMMVILDCIPRFGFFFQTVNQENEKYLQNYPEGLSSKRLQSIVNLTSPWFSASRRPSAKSDLTDFDTSPSGSRDMIKIFPNAVFYPAWSFTLSKFKKSITSANPCKDEGKLQE